MSGRPLDGIISFCEHCLDTYGESVRGVGWFDGYGDTRYRVMLDLVRPSSSPVTLLDFGCGASHLYDYLRRCGLKGIRYTGLDLSERFLEVSRKKYPEVEYLCVDVLDPKSPPLLPFDYVILSGLFTYKGPVSQSQMFDYLRELVRQVFALSRIGIAFNVMSKHVDWEREDLFHVPVDSLLEFLSNELSRHVVIRHDYGLYEYTVYVYRSPSAPEQSAAKGRISKV